MCQHHPDQSHDGSGQPEAQHGDAKEPFPWHLGVYDAHCHPTDTMASVSSIPEMRSRALTIMATRSQDQDLVSEVASSIPYTPSNGDSQTSGQPKCGVIPSFGWHPWFSHQLYDDMNSTSPTYYPASSAEEDILQAKKNHYASVLVRQPFDPVFIASLPTPMPLSSFISSTRSLLQSHPTALVGEIGLDKAFRLPMQWDTPQEASRDEGLTPGGREGRTLSPHRVSLAHQQAVMKAQLRLSGEMGRPVSVHGVQAHGVLHDTVAECWKGYEVEVISKRKQKLAAPGADPDSESDSDDNEEDSSRQMPVAVESRPFPPRICLHSFSASVEIMRQWLSKSYPSSIYFSFSTAVNTSTQSTRSRLREVLAAVPDDRVFVESDLHVAGEDMERALEDMYRLVCEVKGWTLEEGVLRIGENFEEYVFGRQKKKGE